MVALIVMSRPNVSRVLQWCLLVLTYLSFRNALGSSTPSLGSRLLLNPKVHFVPLAFNVNIFAR